VSTVRSIEARELAVGYGLESVVEAINLTLQPGEALALVGTNGSGKSTLLKTLLGLIAPVSGRLRVVDAAPGTRPKQVAYMGQSRPTNSVAPIRVIDVVRMGRFASLGLLGRSTLRDRQLVSDAMEQMAISHLAESSLGSLSGGQRQRVFLAQVLAHDADLIILDEPTSGLDVAGIERCRALIEAARARGAAVVTATHDIAEASACDQVLLLNRRVVAHGTPAEVLTGDRLLETFGIALQGVEHGDHRDLVHGEHPHGHDGEHQHHGHGGNHR
jgi:ABC-type Mn2+/Zn2+ transport system ATPase subunit